MILSLIGLAVGLVGLYFGGDWLVAGASRLARSLGISALIVGLTVVSIGTSMPELLVSVDAALRGSSDIAIGNVVGSNIANIGLILGISGLIYPIRVNVSLLRREIPIMVLVAVAAYVLMRDGTISRGDGGLLLAGMVGFIVLMVILGRQEQAASKMTAAESIDIAINRGKEALRMVAGIAVLMVGARLTVDNAIDIARVLQISELVIGVTVVAVGTSLPELVTSTVAAMRHESDIAIGNVVGSNIFNILGILGATAVIRPILVVAQIVTFDALVMIGFSLLVLSFVINRHLSRLEAIAFLGLYVAYIVYSVVGSVL
ncbi:MAG: calcium/sodium antiporter [Chloroflexota bacterium]